MAAELPDAGSGLRITEPDHEAWGNSKRLSQTLSTSRREQSSLAFAERLPMLGQIGWSRS